MTYSLLFLLFFQAGESDPARLFVEPDARKRGDIVRELTRKFDPSLVAPLVKAGDSDSDPAVRKLLVERLGRNRHPAILEFLERRAASDPDVSVSILALDRLRTLRAQDLAALFEKRLALARSAGSAEDRRTMVAEHQQWVSFARGATLPAFLQAAPPVFEAAPPNKPVRVLAFGDFGSEGAGQTKTAAAAAAYHRQKPFDLGVTLGDNIVPDGVTSLNDPRWKGGWENIYDPLRVPIFAVTGNHDWGYADSPAAEILYSQKSPAWRMPALYYSFTAGPVQFFALATHAMSETQLAWLDRELGRSKSRWKIVYGHHPIYSYGVHGGSQQLERTLLPLLRNRAQVYLAGHEHIVQHLQPEGGVHFFTVTTAGQGERPAVSGPRTLAADTSFGFGVLEADAARLRLAFVDAGGKVRYETTLK